MIQAKLALLFLGAVTSHAVFLEEDRNDLRIKSDRFGRNFRTQSANTQNPENYRDSTIRKNHFGKELDD